MSWIRNKMLTVKILGRTPDLHLLSKGTLKTRFQNYCAVDILQGDLGLCSNIIYVPKYLYLVSNDSWMFYLSYQCKLKAKLSSVDKLSTFKWPYPPNCISASRKIQFFFTIFYLRHIKWQTTSSELSFDTKYVWLELLYVSRLSQQIFTKQP